MADVLHRVIQERERSIEAGASRGRTQSKSAQEKQSKGPSRHQMQSKVVLGWITFRFGVFWYKSHKDKKGAKAKRRALKR